MKSLISTAFLLAFQSDAVLEETSLMQGLVARRGQLATDHKVARKDNTAKLMETALKMMKSGATPDVVEFIERTITEIHTNVLYPITEEHHADQAEIYRIIARFEAAVLAMQQCSDSLRQVREDKETHSYNHKFCRHEESLDCARKRRCDEEVIELWRHVEREEEEMREIHELIYQQWCVEYFPPPHPDIYDPFHWTLSYHWEGDETSQSVNGYPIVDYTPATIHHREVSIDYFHRYILQQPVVQHVWEEYNRKVIECAVLEETWTLKVAVCDDLQDQLRDTACMHSGVNRQCASNFGHEYEMTMEQWIATKADIEIKEYERKREWETLHIVICLLETVYTRVIHSIDTGEPCPTEETDEERTTEEINYCHVIEEEFTRNLTIIYPDPPVPPGLPPPLPFPCSAQYIFEEHGSFPFELQSSHSINLESEDLLAYHAVIDSFGWAGCAAPKACIPCEVEDLFVDPDYVDNGLCKHHHAHLFNGEMDRDTFKCLDGTQCIRAEGRCNGHFNCDDESDELGCDTLWGQPAVLQTEECHADFTSDTQFRCADQSCTHIAGRCNGVQNCADNSDELGCATTTQHVTLEATSGYSINLITPAVNDVVFHDRSYRFDSLGSFTGHSFINMNNADKETYDTHVQMKIRLPQPMTLYVAKLDDTALDWLSEDGWSISSLEGVTYSGTHETRHTDWSKVLVEQHYGPGQVYQKTFPSGVVEMRGNHGGAGSYLTFVAHTANQPTPPSVALWDQHFPGGDQGRVKCNNNVDLHYVSDQLACQELAIANGHTFYSFRHNGESQGHKCMSSATCDNHLDDRTNEWYIYSSAPVFNFGTAGGGNTCLEGTDVSEADCLAAAQSMLASGQVQGRTHLVAGSWGWVPPGCSVQTHFTHNVDGDFAAHYNHLATGNNDGGYTKVCDLPCQHLHNMDVVAGTFAHYGLDYSNSPSDEECSATCTADAECTAWVRQPSTGNCWISRQAVVTFETDSDRTTGLRCN